MVSFKLVVFCVWMFWESTNLLLLNLFGCNDGENPIVCMI